VAAQKAAAAEAAVAAQKVLPVQEEEAELVDVEEQPTLSTPAAQPKAPTLTSPTTPLPPPASDGWRLTKRAQNKAPAAAEAAAAEAAKAVEKDLVVATEAEENDTAAGAK